MKALYDNSVFLRPPNPSSSSTSIPDSGWTEISFMTAIDRVVTTWRPHVLRLDTEKHSDNCYCFFDNDSNIEWTPWGSNTTLVPSHLALLVNSEHSSFISASLNFGSALIVLHALKTSTFLSLFSVFGKFDPAHEIIVPNTLSELFLRLEGAKGDAPAATTRCSNSFFVFGQVPWCTESAPPPSDCGESRGVVKIELDPSIDGDDEDDDMEPSGEVREFTPGGVT